MVHRKDPPAPGRKRRAWWIVGGVLGVIVLLPQIIISIWGTALGSTMLARELDKPVAIRKVWGGWWSGLEIEGLTISDAFEAKTDKLLEIGKIRLENPVWMLILPNAAVNVAIDDVRLELRRLANGEWNVADLQPTRGTEAPENVLLPRGQLILRVTRGKVYLAPENLEYSLAAEAESASLRDQPLQWRIELSTRDGSSLSGTGSFANLATPKEITGTVGLQMARLDLEMIPPLVPSLPVMYPHGIVEKGDVRVDLTGLTQFQVHAALDLRDISLPDIGHESDVSLSRGSIRLALQRNRNRWTFETLSLKGPHGSVSLVPEGWLELSAEAWRGNLDLRAELEDAEPGSRALAMLFPDPLMLAGPLSIEASVEGELSLDTQKAWPERLADLRAHFALSQARAQWRNEPLEDIVAKVDLDRGRLTVPKVGASVGQGHVSLQGTLALGEAPDGGLTWLVADVSLANLLGPDVRVFDISKGSGKLTFDGSMYRLESQTAVRKLAFDREALGDRQLQIENAQLQCTGTLPPDLALLNVTSCRLKASQGELSSKKGQLDLGANPKLGLELEGWLGGPFLSELVPEFTPEWPAKVNLKGPLTVPVTGKTWQNMQWRFNAGGKNFAWAGFELTDLEGRITKSVGRLDFSISGRRGPGSLLATGSLDLGSGDIAKIELKADRVPLRREISGYMLTGTVFGSAQVTIDAQGARLSFRNSLEDVKLSQDRKVISRLARGKVEGELKRTGRGGLWVKQLSLVGDGLSVRMRDSHLPLTAGNEPLELNVEFAGDGSWLGLVAAVGGAEQVLASGQSQLSLKLQAQPGRVLESMNGTGRLKAARLSLWGASLSNADAVFDLQPNTVGISHSEAQYKGGKLTLGGKVVLPILQSRRDEQLTLVLEEIPVRHVQLLSSYGSGGPANLVTETGVRGRVRLERDSGGGLALSAELQSDPISRRIIQQNERASEAKLPPLQVASRLTARNSLDAWAVESFTVRGNGALIELTSGQLARRNSAYELTGLLALELSPEILRAVAMGLLPARFDVTGDMKADGQAMFRIPHTRPAGPGDIDFAGTMNIQELKVGPDTLRALRLTLRLAGGQLDIQNGEASLLGGRLWMPSPSAVSLEGPARDFKVHVAAKDLQLRAYGGRQVSLGRFLALLVPIFLLRPDGDEKRVSMTGVLQFDLQLDGTYQKTAEWTRSVNGKGTFRIDNGAVQGSSLVTGILARSLLMPTNVVNNTVAALFSKDGKVGRELADLADDTFRFQTIESPITITNGEIFLEKNLKVSSPELGLTINGHSNLDGELDYNVDTDLIRRVRLGEITDLPNKIPIIGKVLSFLNPFSYLDGIELRARVTGNVLKPGPEGRSDVRVQTSVVDTKAG